MSEKNSKNLYGDIEDFCEKKLLDVRDIQELFGVGIVKATKIMNIVPHFRVGHKNMCTRIALFRAATQNKLKINW